MVLFAKLLLHIASQVTQQKCTTTDYLDSSAGIVRSSNLVNQRKFVSLLRQNKQVKLSDFSRFSRERLVVELSKNINSKPLFIGDIDENTLRMPVDKFVQREVHRFFSCRVD